MTAGKIIRAVIIDDEPLARRKIRQMLARDPEVEVVGDCGNGREAIAAINAQNPDLVFLDVQMPEVDGFAVLESIAAVRTPLVIFVTAYDQYALRAFEVSAVDYLVKPFDLDELVARILAVQRRSAEKASPLIRVGCLVIDQAARQARYAQRPHPHRPAPWPPAGRRASARTSCVTSTRRSRGGPRSASGRSSRCGSSGCRATCTAPSPSSRC